MRQKTRCLSLTLVLVATATGGSETARAGDMVLKASILNTKFKVGEQKDSYEITGFAPSVAYMMDRGKHLSFGIQMQPLVNFTNTEIARNAIDGIVEFAVLGQTHKLLEEYETAEVSATGRWAINAILHVGNAYYSATPGTQKKNSGQKSVDKVTGNTLQTEAGLGTRIDITDETSAGFELLYTVISLANSKENLTATEAQTGFFFRFEF